MPDPVEIPNKLYFRIGEVCRLLKLEPYVLRFWESEFPTLSPTKGANGRRMYRKKDVEMGLYKIWKGEPTEDLDEVDTDPSNNPGRPEDAYEYLGMHPSPTAAMAHPAAAGTGVASGEGGDGETSSEPVGGAEEPAKKPTEDT